MKKRNPLKPWETSVYLTQCWTWGRAKEMLGLRGDAIRCDIEAELANPSLSFGFRMLPAYRTPRVLAFRREVAQAIREERRHGNS